MSEAIEYHRFPRGDHCTFPGCPAKRYYIDSGKRICRLGHEQEGFRQVQSDEDDFGTQGKVTRKRREEKEKVQKTLRGREARELFVCCWQLVLWKQVHWLIKQRGCPEELEVVVRDLWAVRLRDVKGVGGDDAREGGSERELGFSSQTEWETGTETEGRESGTEMERRRRKAERDRGMPKLIDSLSLCYLGILLMRLPIGLGELHMWAVQEDIIYFRAIREVPKEMRARLPAEYHAALESRSVLKGGDLHKAVLSLVISFRERHELIFPPLNAPLIIFKHVRDLCLPLDTYAAARRLGKILDCNYSFPDKLGRHDITAYPEVQILSLIVIATKLCHPFDDIVRVPESLVDSSALRIDWNAWQDIMHEKPVKGFRKGEHVGVTDADVFEMNDEKLDEYLDWYQRTWIDDRDPKVPQQLLDLFPLQDLPPKDSGSKNNIDIVEDRLRSLTQSLVWQKPIPLKEGGNESEINRPGSLYRRYRSVEDLPGNARAFYNKAAENAGLSLEMIVRAVSSIEGRLFQWVMNEKRRKMMAQHKGDTDEMDSEERYH